jgi:LemA protein
MIHSLLALGIVLAVVVLILLSTYNSLTHQRHEVRAAWAKMDEQLKRRYDLMPDLLTVVQSHGGDPAAELPDVSSAKNRAAVAFDPADLASAEIALTVAIHQVLTAAERDPALSANPKFVEVRRNLLASEKQIDQARKRYNDDVDHLNESLSSFPTIFTAKLVGLKPQPAFVLPIEAD